MNAKKWKRFIGKWKRGNGKVHDDAASSLNEADHMNHELEMLSFRQIKAPSIQKWVS